MEMILDSLANMYEKEKIKQEEEGSWILTALT